MNTLTHQPETNSESSKPQNFDAYFATNLHELIGDDRIVWLFRLLMGREMLGAAFRWLELINNEAQDRARTIAFDLRVCTSFALCVVREARRVLKEAKEKHLLDEEMLSANPELHALFEQLTSVQGNDLTKCADEVRNTFFAHWDLKRIKKSLKSFDNNALEVPFSVSALGKGIPTTFPLSQRLVENEIGKYFPPANQVGNPVGPNLQKLFESVLGLSSLLSVFAEKLGQKAGLRLKRKEMKLKSPVALADGVH